MKLGHRQRCVNGAEYGEKKKKKMKKTKNKRSPFAWRSKIIKEGEEGKEL